MYTAILWKVVNIQNQKTDRWIDTAQIEKAMQRREVGMNIIAMSTVTIVVAAIETSDEIMEMKVEVVDQGIIVNEAERGLLGLQEGQVKSAAAGKKEPITEETKQVIIRVV